MNTNIHFRGITEDEFYKFAKWSINNYAQNLIKSGQCTTQNALQCSKEDFYETFPDGKYISENNIYIAVNENGTDVGVIQYTLDSPTKAFIEEFIVSKKYRRMGYGRQTLYELEHKLKSIGITEISLHVFEKNLPARSLYNQVGYKIAGAEPGSIYMKKIYK